MERTGIVSARVQEPPTRALPGSTSVALASPADSTARDGQRSVSALPGITGGWLQSGSSSASRSWRCAARIARGRAWPPGVPGSMRVRCCRGRQLPQNESSALWPGCCARRKVANWAARFTVGGPLELDVGPCERRQHGPGRDRWGWQKASDLNRFPDAPVTGACIRFGRHGVTVQSSRGGAVPSRWRRVLTRSGVRSGASVGYWPPHTRSGWDWRPRSS